MRATPAVVPDLDHLRMSGTRPGLTRSRPRTYATGRVCVADGCRTLLSRYNRAELCWQHEPRRPMTTAVRGRQPDHVEVLNELLSQAS